MPTTAHIIIADGEVDQVCETAAQARKERRDLEGMGCTVKVKTCPWEDQNAVIDRMAN